MMKQNRNKVISGAAGFIVLCLILCCVSFSNGAVAEEGAAKEDVYYIVRQGDCLWKISDRFYDDPFLWPFVWQNNPGIANPHWIYPGDRILLASVEGEAREQPPPMGATAAPVLPNSPEVAGARPLVVPRSLADTALLSEAEMKPAGWVLASLDGRMLLSQGDELYVELRGDQAIPTGSTLQIVRKGREVRHPRTGKKMGNLVSLMGFAKTTGEPESGVVPARVLFSNGGIERGDLVTEAALLPVPALLSKPASRAIEGCVVASVGDTDGISQYDVCFIDKGLADGVEVGDSFWVMRPSEEVKAIEHAGKVTLPEDRIGMLVVLLTEKNSSTVLVTNTETTFSPGYPVASKTE